MGPTESLVRGMLRADRDAQLAVVEAVLLELARETECDELTVSVFVCPEGPNEWSVVTLDDEAGGLLGPEIVEGNGDGLGAALNDLFLRSAAAAVD